MHFLTVGAWSGRQAPTIGGMDDFPSLLGATSTEHSELDVSTQTHQEQTSTDHSASMCAPKIIKSRTLGVTMRSIAVAGKGFVKIQPCRMTLWGQNEGCIHKRVHVHCISPCSQPSLIFYMNSFALICGSIFLAEDAVVLNP